MTEKYNPEELAGMKVLSMFACTPADVITIQPVRSLDDLKGKELRASGTGVTILKALGATPVAMPQSEVPAALQKRIIVGYASATETLWDFKYAEICKYSTNAKLFPVSFSVTMNWDSWKALPPSVQKVLEDLSFENAIWTGQYEDMHSAEALIWAKKQHGLEEISLTPAEFGTWHALTKPLINEWKAQAAAKGLPAEQILSDAYDWKAEAEAKYGTELMPSKKFVDELYANKDYCEKKYGATFILK
jgi:TRAP-type C4-dicarboxylate transport system substrate-binding protein